MARMTKHGVNGYRHHKCRCKACCKAYEGSLERKRNSRRTVRRLPSVTNTLLYDTMTRKQFDQLRGSDVA